jgi:hypothetical protein
MQFCLNFVKLIRFGFIIIFYMMSYNNFMLCYYGCSVALDVNNNITYNSESSVLLHVICKKKKSYVS